MKLTLIVVGCGCVVMAQVLSLGAKLRELRGAFGLGTPKLSKSYEHPQSRGCKNNQSADN
jgi:hypothetical protein